LTYGDKTQIRNDVLVAVGSPLTVAAATPADDAEAVRALTDDITKALANLVAGVVDPLQAWAHERAAAVVRRRDRREPTLAETRTLARATVRAAPAVRTDVERAIADYTLALDLAGVDDAAVAGTVRPGYATLAIRAVITWLALPFVVSIALLNGPATALVVLVDRVVQVPVTKGTVRALVAAVAFPTSWVVAGVLTVEGRAAVTAFFVLQPILLLALLWLVEGDVRAVRRWAMSRRARATRARIPTLGEYRARVIAAVDACAVSPS
jgi:hypothetical protein